MVTEPKAGSTARTGQRTCSSTVQRFQLRTHRSNSNASNQPVGASPVDANQEEKDSLDLGSANSTKVTPALVQLGPSGGNTKELPDKTNFMGEARSVQ